jgi:hypothetical protein
MGNGSTTTYKDQPVTLIRPATFQDQGFNTDPTVGDQLLVQFEDGHQEVVVKAEIEGTFMASNEPGTETEPAPTDPPTVVDRPYAGQTGATLNCTMGNWNDMQAEPHSYAYQWQREGVDVDGATSADYTVTPADVDHIMACIVTATNAIGSDSATSNEVNVTAASF